MNNNNEERKTRAEWKALLEKEQELITRKQYEQEQLPQAVARDYRESAHIDAALCTCDVRGFPSLNCPVHSRVALNSMIQDEAKQYAAREAQDYRVKE